MSLALVWGLSRGVIDLTTCTFCKPQATDRLYVLNVTEGDVHFSWKWRSTIVRFRMLDAALSSESAQPSVADAVRDLTDQAQTPDSKLFDGYVTSALDAHWGVVYTHDRRARVSRA